MSRRELLAGAAAGTALASGVLASGAPAATGGGDTLGEALTVELLAVFCYQHVLGLGILGAEATQLARQILAHEQEHVRALEALLGGPQPGGPSSVAEADDELKARHSSGRLTGLKSEHAILDFLYSVESINIGAYDQALEKLSDQQQVRTSVAIMGAEAQHAAAIGSLLHPGQYDRIVPVDFVKGKT